MSKPKVDKAQALTRRERQIMDVIWRQQRVTAAEVQAALPDPPSYSAVRALLRLLEEKGHIRHLQDGPRYVFVATAPRASAERSALRHLVETFFGGSVERAVASLLDESSKNLDDETLARLEARIRAARDEGR